MASCVITSGCRGVLENVIRRSDFSAKLLHAAGNTHQEYCSRRPLHQDFSVHQPAILDRNTNLHTNHPKTGRHSFILSNLAAARCHRSSQCEMSKMFEAHHSRHRSSLWMALLLVYKNFCDIEAQANARRVVETLAPQPICRHTPYFYSYSYILSSEVQTTSTSTSTSEVLASLQVKVFLRH